MYYFLSKLFSYFRVDDETKVFILDHYLPEIEKATAHMLPLPEEEKSKLTGNLLGTLLKLGYAFLWQVLTIIRSFILVFLHLYL